VFIGALARGGLHRRRTGANARLRGCGALP
jgi:hypothetical protein